MASPQERALQSDIPPKNKSDSEWLRDMGYRGLHEFAIIFGFKITGQKYDEEDDARRLIGEFRDEQQEEWEALRRDKSSLGKPTAENSEAGPSMTDGKEAKKRELVQLAVLWHKRLGHASYHAVLALSKAKQGLPEFAEFGGLEVRDLPACEICTSCGSDPFSYDEWRRGG